MKKTIIVAFALCFLLLGNSNVFARSSYCYHYAQKYTNFDVYNSSGNLVYSTKSSAFKKSYQHCVQRRKRKLKNTLWFYSGHLNTTGLNIKVKLVPISAYKDYSHIHIKLYFKNNRNIPFTVNLTKTKTLFIPQSGITYGITWYELSNGFINVNKYGKGCALANRNTELLINPGADCSISMPVRVPGFSKNINITPKLDFGDNIAISLSSVSKYEYEYINPHTAYKKPL
jgi:hypothetical protein